MQLHKRFTAVLQIITTPSQNQDASKFLERDYLRESIENPAFKSKVCLHSKHEKYISTSSDSDRIPWSSNDA